VSCMYDILTNLCRIVYINRPLGWRVVLGRVTKWVCEKKLAKPNLC
jgi:hypothetical protein